MQATSKDMQTKFMTTTDAGTMKKWSLYEKSREKAIKNMIQDFQSWKKVRMIGSAAMASAYVASGKADFYKEYGIYLWDVAAGAAIVEAAGGKVSFSNKNNKHQVDAFFSNYNLIHEHH